MFWFFHPQSRNSLHGLLWRRCFFSQFLVDSVEIENLSCYIYVSWAGRFVSGNGIKRIVIWHTCYMNEIKATLIGIRLVWVVMVSLEYSIWQKPWDFGAKRRIFWRNRFGLFTSDGILVSKLFSLVRCSGAIEINTTIWNLFKHIQKKRWGK